MLAVPTFSIANPISENRVVGGLCTRGGLLCRVGHRLISDVPCGIGLDSLPAHLALCPPQALCPLNLRAVRSQAREEPSPSSQDVRQSASLGQQLLKCPWVLFVEFEGPSTAANFNERQILRNGLAIHTQLIHICEFKKPYHSQKSAQL